MGKKASLESSGRMIPVVENVTAVTGVGDEAVTLYEFNRRHHENGHSYRHTAIHDCTVLLPLDTSVSLLARLKCAWTT